MPSPRITLKAFLVVNLGTKPDRLCFTYQSLMTRETMMKRQSHGVVVLNETLVCRVECKRMEKAEETHLRMSVIAVKLIMIKKI